MSYEQSVARQIAIEPATDVTTSCRFVTSLVGSTLGVWCGSPCRISLKSRIAYCVYESDEKRLTRSETPSIQYIDASILRHEGDRDQCGLSQRDEDGELRRSVKKRLVAKLSRIRDSKVFLSRAQFRPHRPSIDAPGCDCCCRHEGKGAFTFAAMIPRSQCRPRNNWRVSMRMPWLPRSKEGRNC